MFFNHFIIIQCFTLISWYWIWKRRRMSYSKCINWNWGTGILIGIIIFILSEVLFFCAWFWGFFHNSWSPINEIGNTWPPTGVCTIDVLSIPLLNTLLLLTRGISVTWAHNSYINMKKIGIQIFVTLIFGIFFTVNQLVEYLECDFSLSDSIYGSSFFITTGFHGLHVIVGRLFLLWVSTVIIRKNNNPFVIHLSFEFSIWYWHFVDVVWLFLFFFIYMIN